MCVFLCVAVRALQSELSVLVNIGSTQQQDTGRQVQQIHAHNTSNTPRGCREIHLIYCTLENAVSKDLIKRQKSRLLGFFKIGEEKVLI